MRTRITALIALITLLCATVAFAAPTKLSQQGRLLDGDGTPLTGGHSLAFTLHDAETDGNEFWREERVVEFEAGYYSIILGTVTPLDDLLFAGGTVWMQLAVDGEELSPRQEVVSVPYALRSAVAESVEGGAVDADEVAIGGNTVIDSSGNWLGTPTDWSELTGVPADLSDGDADSDTLLGLPCADGFVAKFSTTLGAWDCAQDNDSLAELVCLTGEIPVYDLVTGLWFCGADLDTDTQLTEAQVDAFVANNNYSTGAHTTDTDTQLTEAQVDAFVANNNYSTGAHTTVSVTPSTPFSLPSFAIPGTPPPAAMAPHLRMPHDQLVIVDYPENLTAAGLNHREVIEAAISMFPQYQGQPQTHGFWEKGEVRFQVGSYIIDQEIEWPARLNLIGASRYVRNGGTRFWASAGMTEDDYIIRLLSGDHFPNVNGNFFQHLRNVHFNGNNFSSGVAWGGAQSSSMKNVEIQGIPEGGTCVLIQTGTNAMIVEAVWCDGESRPDTTGFKGGPIIEGGLTFIACKAENIAVGFDLERGDHYAVGAYFENIGIPVIRRGNTGNTRFMGLSVKNITGVGANGLPLVFDLPDGLANFYASGIVRESDQAVGYERSGVFYELLAESLFVLPSGQPNTAQRGYEVNVLEHVHNIPLELDGDTDLRIGRRYFEDFGGGSAHSVTFVGPEEEGKRVELRTESTGSVTLDMPESAITGSDVLLDEVTLDAGYHVLIWERIGGQWWLRVD